MAKVGVSTADSYYLHIKHIGESSFNNSQRVMLEGPMKSLQMFLNNAMCQWVYYLLFILLSHVL